MIKMKVWFSDKRMVSKKVKLLFCSNYLKYPNSWIIQEFDKTFDYDNLHVKIYWKFAASQ